LTSQVQVVKATSSMSFYNDDRGCSVPESFPVNVGDQIRVTRNPSEYALYTVEQKRQQDNGTNRVRMGTAARKRLGTSKEFGATLSIPVVAPANMSDTEARDKSEFVERLVDDGSKRLCVVACHGGTIETHTDVEAEHVTAQMKALGLACCSWICKGWRAGGGSFERWHITATDLSPNSFPGLWKIQDRNFKYCVSFHGMSADGVLVGGADLELREIVAAAIAETLEQTSIEVRVATDDDPLRGTSPENVVNWLTESGMGVQIEQSRTARVDHWEKIVDAVVGVYSDLP
jgi:phage replication-related protein YjqB (UPF0714/DUF867 family)